MEHRGIVPPRARKLMSQLSWTPAGVFWLLVAAFGLVDIYLGLGTAIQRTSDSGVFTSMAKDHSTLSRYFWCGPRPPLTAMILKLAHNSERLFVATQWLLHAISWGALARFFFMHSRNRAIGFVLATSVLAIAVTPQVHLWNSYVMSESLSISCLPLIFLCLANSRCHKSWRHAVFLGSVLTAISLAKDIGSYLTAPLVIALVLGFLKSAPCRRKLGMLTVLAVGCIAFSTLTADTGVPTPADRRWLFPFFNVVGQRILTSPDHLSALAVSGMPVDDVLLDRAGKWASDDGFRFYTDPRLQSFRDWAIEDGKVAYASFLIRHPRYTFGAIYRNMPLLLHYVPSALAGYYPESYPRIGSPIYRAEANLLLTLLPLIIALPLTAFRSQSKGLVDDRDRFVTTLAAVAPIPMLLLVCFHGDAMDVPRHTVLIGVYFRLLIPLVAYHLCSRGSIWHATGQRFRQKQNHILESPAADYQSTDDDVAPASTSTDHLANSGQAMRLASAKLRRGTAGSPLPNIRCCTSCCDNASADPSSGSPIFDAEATTYLPHSTRDLRMFATPGPSTA